MKQKRVLVIIFVCLAFAGLVTVRAQSGGDPSAMLGASYDLTWNTVVGGGGVSRSGAYALGGAIGQPDAGSLNGGNYTLSGGFWQSQVNVEPTAYRIFLPLVMSQCE